MLSDLRTFLGAWLTSPAKVGAVTPSSQALARRMVRGLSPAAGESIVEFGPGTGPFTRQIQEALADPSCYLGIEREERFVSLLRTRFPALRFSTSSAEEAPRLVKEAGLERVTAVVCGLPFASLPPRIQDGVINALDELLGPGCEFRTFQYVHAYVLPAAVRYRKRMKEVFGPHERSRAVIWNFPPAYVLTWRR